MKYWMTEDLVLRIEPESCEEQALVNILRSMELKYQGIDIKNAGKIFNEGRRMSLTYRFLVGWETDQGEAKRVGMKAYHKNEVKEGEC